MEIPDSQQALYQALLDVIPHGRELTGRLLGKWLTRYEGRVIDKMRIIKTQRKEENMILWKLQKI